MKVYEVMDLLGRAPASAEVIISTSLKKEELLEYGDDVGDGVFSLELQITDIDDPVTDIDDPAIITVEPVKH